MFNSNNTPFTMPVMPATGGYSDGGAWGDGGWLWIIVVFALLFGWGNNGFGGFGGRGCRQSELEVIPSARYMYRCVLLRDFFMQTMPVPTCKSVVKERRY